MNSRVVGVAVLVTAVLVAGGLWLRVYRLREERARYEAHRLNNPAMLNGPRRNSAGIATRVREHNHPDVLIMRAAMPTN